MAKIKCLLCNEKIEDIAKHGHHLECFQEIFTTKKRESDFEDLILKDSEEKSGDINRQRITTSTFYHGAFKKYSARIENKKLILKVREKEYPELPKVEFISNQIADNLGIEVAPFYYILLNNKVPTFVTQNVLDFHAKGNLIHIWHYLKNDGDLFDELSLINIISILKRETIRPVDVKKFIEISLFDMVIGNGDRHGRNLAIIEKLGKKVLSPAYDNPSNIGIFDEEMLGMDISVKGKIYTNYSQEPSLKDYVNEFKEFGYDGICNNFLTKAKKLDYEKIILHNDKTNLSIRRKQSFLNLIKKNLKDIDHD